MHFSHLTLTPILHRGFYKHRCKNRSLDLLRKGLLHVFFLFLCSTVFAQEIKNFKVIIGDYISLTWDNPSVTYEGYDIYRSTSLEILGRRLNRKITKQNKYTDYNAGVGETYFYQIHAVDKDRTAVVISSTATVYISPFYSETVYTPTAFQTKRKAGEHFVRTKYLFQRSPLFGFNIDFILNYYIGRLFGLNNPDKCYAKDKYDYLTRVGIWLLSGDLRIVFPYLEKRLCSLAVGGRYTYMFRDIPQPQPGAAPEFVIKPSKSKGLPSVYAVLSKSWTRNTFHLGLIQGKEHEIIPQLSDYIYWWYYRLEHWESSERTVFFGFRTRIIPRINLKVEAMHPLKNSLDPWLFNIDLGRFLPANFQIAYLRYKYGWDILGYFNFRHTFYPPQK